MLLVLDRAGWHISHQLELPEGLDLYFLPAHSPELQPAERLWPLTNEVIANRSPRSLSELEELLVVRCHNLILNTLSNSSAGKVRNRFDIACWLILVGLHHKNPSLANSLVQLG